MQKIILVRHGETAWTLSRQHTGKTDIPLTEKGKVQAAKIGDFLQSFALAKAFISPSLRARTTFLLSKIHVDHTFDPDLHEWDYGIYEGRTTEDIRKEAPNWSVFKEGAPQGESVEQMQARADRMIAKAKEISGDVVFFSSGHILRSIAARFIQQPVGFGAHLLLHAGSVCILGYERENPAIALWNQELC